MGLGAGAANPNHDRRVFGVASSAGRIAGGRGAVRRAGVSAGGDADEKGKGQDQGAKFFYLPHVIDPPVLCSFQTLKLYTAIWYCPPFL